jgi:hypothetical protein
VAATLTGACLLGLSVSVTAGDVDALYKAAGVGDTAAVAALLDSGVDVDGRSSNGSYALNNAAVENEMQIMHFLLERGADPNVQNSQGDTPRPAAREVCRALRYRCRACGSAPGRKYSQDSTCEAPSKIASLPGAVLALVLARGAAGSSSICFEPASPPAF